MLTINNTVDGYLKNVQIKGNTVQDPVNLSSIKSVGTKVEGQDLYEIPLLSVGKNLFDGEYVNGSLSSMGVLFEDNASITTKNTILVGGGVSLTIKRYDKVGTGQICYYDKNNTFISRTSISVQSITVVTPSNCKYIMFSLGGTRDFSTQLQVECGTQATPYEAYKEDKLTILSPVQLEKVGTVQDVIKEVDGVWGVDDKSKDILVNGKSNWVDFAIEPGGCGRMLFRTGIPIGENILSNIKKIPYSNSWNTTELSFAVLGNGADIALYIPQAKTSSEFKEKLDVLGGIFIKYVTTTPAFIPLPHSQQVKLRTFANKTNISFLCEIEGTIKADVPKSLGATVNVHTKEIDNIYTELDRVKKLEQSTVSTVTTDKDFVSVQETTQGYFEDVELKGRTLVNKSKFRGATWSIPTGGTYGYRGIDVSMLEVGKTYTARIFGYSSNVTQFIIGEGSASNPYFPKQNIDVVKFVCPKVSDIYNLFVYPSSTGSLVASDVENIKIQILDGDNTQVSVQYFAGLASVGDGTDEIVVSSRNHSQNGMQISMEQGSIASDTGIPSSSTARLRSINFIEYTAFTDVVNIDYSIFDIAFLSYDRDKNYIGTTGWISNNSKLISGCVYYKIIIKFKSGTTITPNDINVYHSKTDKKKLLYFDPTDNTWKKPVLDEFSTVKKGSDGVYRYYKRGEKVVLDGSESWRSADLDSKTRQFFIQPCSPLVVNSDGTINSICNKYDNISFNQRTGKNGCFATRDILAVVLPIATTTEQFKSDLVTKNLEIVYQLATEKVYECTNIDLITYENETNFTVKSGVLSPKTTLKVHSNISNVVSLLQNKVSLLESNMTKYMITQNRLMLASRYNADSASFKIDYNSMYSEKLETEVDEDLFKLLQHNIIVGIDNYDYNKMIDMMDFYAINGFISWDMWDELWIMMELQHNPPVEVPEEAPEI
ncbi:MAG: hypothetical protein ACRC18_06325 [Cetobacterium sp.]